MKTGQRSEHSGLEPQPPDPTTTVMCSISHGMKRLARITAWRSALQFALGVACFSAATWGAAVTPAATPDADRSIFGCISDDPEPIGGVTVDQPDLIGTVSDDGPEPFGRVINDNPDPLGMAIGDSPDPFVGAIVDVPEPNSGGHDGGPTLTIPKALLLCAGEGHEPILALEASDARAGVTECANPMCVCVPIGYLTQVSN